MAKKQAKKKAVRKIEKAVRKAVNKGVTGKAVGQAVEQAMEKPSKGKGSAAKKSTKAPVTRKPAKKTLPLITQAKNGDADSN